MWVVLALVAALGDALRDASSKRVATGITPLIVSWSYSIYALPFFLYPLWQGPRGELSYDFWVLLGLMGMGHVGGGILLVRALSTSELSLCAPMIAFTPVFLLFVGPLLTGEFPNIYGLCGTFLVVLGSYVLNLSSLSHGITAPMRALVNQTGPRVMLGLAFLWSLTSSVDKIAAPKFGAAFWASCQMTVISLLFVPLVVKRLGLAGFSELRNYRKLCPVGICNAVSLYTYLIAMGSAPVYYVICIKRLSILFAILLGRLFFGETATMERFAGGMLMLLGVIVISTLG